MNLNTMKYNKTGYQNDVQWLLQTLYCPNKQIIHCKIQDYIKVHHTNTQTIKIIYRCYTKYTTVQN